MRYRRRRKHPRKRRNSRTVARKPQFYVGVSNHQRKPYYDPYGLWLVLMATTQIKDGFNGGSDNQLKVNPDGSINVNTSGGGPTSNVTIVQGGNTAVVDAGGNLHVLTSGSSTVTGTVNTVEKGLANFQTSQYTVGVTAVQITPSPLANRSSISLRVTASANQAIFIGNNNTLTIANGYPLYNGDTLQMDLTPTNTIYAIATLAGQTLYILEIAYWHV